MDKEKRVLVIDDEDAIRELLKEFLEENGCTVTTEATAEDGLMQLRKDQYDLVLLDIMLRHTNGLTVLQSIKKIAPELSVIMITGNNDITLAEECLSKGATDYISKPFDFDYLKDSVLVSLFL